VWGGCRGSWGDGVGVVVHRVVVWAVVAVHGVGSPWFTDAATGHSPPLVEVGARVALSSWVMVMGHPGCPYVVLLAVCWWCFAVVATLTVKDDIGCDSLFGCHVAVGDVAPGF
jgi:hypothetical protein